MAERTARDLEALDARCGAAWEARGLLAGRAAAPLAEDAEERIRADLLDLALLWADLRRRLAPPGGPGDGGAAVEAFDEGGAVEVEDVAAGAVAVPPQGGPGVEVG